MRRWHEPETPIGPMSDAARGLLGLSIVLGLLEVGVALISVASVEGGRVEPTRDFLIWVAFGGAAAQLALIVASRESKRGMGAAALATMLLSFMAVLAAYFLIGLMSAVSVLGGMR